MILRGASDRQDVVERHRHVGGHDLPGRLETCMERLACENGG
jgi:hypothetical protein